MSPTARFISVGVAGAEDKQTVADQGLTAFGNPACLRRLHLFPVVLPQPYSLLVGGLGRQPREDDLNQIVLPKFGVLDMSVRIPVASKLSVYVAIENALDQEYAVRADPLEILGTPRMVHGGIELRLLN